MPSSVAQSSAERWRALEPLLDAALAAEPGRRDAVLRDACGGDRALYAEAAAMLAECADGDPRLDRPAAARFAALLDTRDVDGGSAPAAGTADVGALCAALDGRYTIGRELGRGGMGVVYLARDVRHERDVALKVVGAELAVGASGAARFLAEIRVTAALRHPHILPLFDSGTAGDRLYYVAPYVEGGTLRDWLAREAAGGGGALPVGDVTRVLREVAGALAHAHARGVVHRDVKPENVLLGEGGAVLGDFGIAKAVARAAEGGDGPSLTRPGLGTPAYMAPEQRTGGPVDHRADLYALGMVAYELLAGRPPAAAAEVGAAPEPLAAHRTDVPPALDTLVVRLLAPSPADRVQSADDVLRALQAFGADRGDGAGAPGGPAAVVRPRAGARRRAAVLAGAVALAAVAGVWAGRPAPGRAGAAPPAPARDTALLAEGGRALRAGNLGTARRLLALAARNDPGSAVAWLRLAEAVSTAGDAQWRVSARRAAALAGPPGSETAHAAALARAMLAFGLGEPDPLRVVEVADAVARDYPTDAAAQRYAGLARTHTGDHLGALAPLMRAIALDSAMVARGRTERPDPDGYEGLLAAYSRADSLAAYERVARRWLARDPDSPRAQLALVIALEITQRYDEALAEMRRLAARVNGLEPALGGTAAVPSLELARLSLSARRYADADRLVDALLRLAPADQQSLALAYRVVSLRAQHRRAEALGVARALRRRLRADREAGRGGYTMDYAHFEAQALLDVGRPREAARLFDSLAAFIGPWHPDVPALAARQRAWHGTQAAGALADAGDTTELGRRADSIRADGRRSHYGSDGRLHHHVRGRLWALRGDHVRAVREYEAAVFCPALCYTRNNLLLARSLDVLGRRDEAVTWLRRAARGQVLIDGMFVTRTDVDSALADVFARQGRADSARFYRARVDRAVGRGGRRSGD